MGKKWPREVGSGTLLVDLMHSPKKRGSRNGDFRVPTAGFETAV
jgi:hypothetical protein